MTSFVKSVQMQFARDLQARWWRLEAEYRNPRGARKVDLLETPRKEKDDINSYPAFHTTYVTPSAEMTILKKRREEKDSIYATSAVHTTSRPPALTAPASAGIEEESAFPEFV